MSVHTHYCHLCILFHLNDCVFVHHNQCKQVSKLRYRLRLICRLHYKSNLNDFFSPVATLETTILLTHLLPPSDFIIFLPIDNKF